MQICQAETAFWKGWRSHNAYHFVSWTNSDSNLFYVKQGRAGLLVRAS